MNLIDFITSLWFVLLNPGFRQLSTAVVDNFITTKLE